MTPAARCTLPLTFVLFLVAPLSATATDSSWQSSYEDALALLERKRFDTAEQHLVAAVESEPQPRLAETGESVDYIPWINLAATRYELGQVAAARTALERSAHYGVATRSYVGRQLWDLYALRIIASDQDQGQDQSKSNSNSKSMSGDYRDFERKEFSLPEQEAAQIRRQVLRRCALSGKRSGDKLPWYFHYEYGLELLEAGDPQRAVDELIMATSKLEQSARGKRMYGMWFTNYLPYYRIALAHSQLGNWRCAMDAMRLSAWNGEFSPTDRGFEDYSDLEKLIMRHNDRS